MDNNYHFFKHLPLVRAHKFDDIDAEIFSLKKSALSI